MEDTSKEQRLLKEWDSNFFRNNFNEVNYRATQIYFEEAHSILHNFVFESEIQKEVWRLHCEGLSVREIASQIKSYKKSMVHYLIRNLSRMIKD